MGIILRIHELIKKITLLKVINIINIMTIR